jgi:hypothetical protein
MRKLHLWEFVRDLDWRKIVTDVIALVLAGIVLTTCVAPPG